MGPFPHNAPKATITKDNPAGTDGFEFVEFAHEDPQVLRDLFARMGYDPHRQPQDQGDRTLAAGRYNLRPERRTRQFRRALRRRAWPLRAFDGLARRRCATMR